MGDTPLLEVLIPTYGRPESAVSAIRSVLEGSDEKVSVFCHSNGHEPELEEYCLSQSRVRYGSFVENRGPHHNGYTILSGTVGKFCMILSDEDRLDASQLSGLLELLETLRSDCNLVSCAVYSDEESRYSYGVESIHKRYVSLAGFTIISASPYMSGFVYRSQPLSQLDLRDLLGLTARYPDGAPYNQYSHLDISQRLLINGSCCFYHSPLVRMGRTIRTGGNAYSHKSHELEVEGDGNLDLNPDVYGAYARVRQYLYRDLLLSSLQPYFPATSYVIASAKLCKFFYERLFAVSAVVRLHEKYDFRSEFLKALGDAQLEGHISGSPFSRMFSDSLLQSQDERATAYALVKSITDQPLRGLTKQLYIG
jgi:hypothetical protein